MTLSRQLMLSGLVILLFLFLGMITFVVKNTQSFLNQQLASHSQDTATALGLTLTTIMKNNDIVTASRSVDAIWDRGYYKSIKIESVNGSPLVERHGEIKVYGVPQWFIKELPLHTEPKQAVIMDGWRKIGKVEVESNPGFAYKQIWSTFVESSWWFLITAFIAVLLGATILYIILRPLRAITQQAIAICNQQFSIQKTLPWTIDLRLVVEAMNNMSIRLKKMFEDQAHLSEQWREQAFKDPVTKLGNRRYLDLQLDYLLQDKEKEHAGALFLIELQAFKEYNDKYGYTEGDLLLQNTAHAIEACCQQIENAIITHAKGATLSVIIVHKPKEVVIDLANRMCSAFKEFQTKSLSKEPAVAHIGIAFFKQGEDKKSLLANADMALRKAQTLGNNQWSIIEDTHQEAQGAQEWGAIFNDVIANNKILLYFQEIAFWIQSPAIYETLMRIKLDNEKIISAGVFMPMAERLNKIKALDTLVIENVIQKILSTKSDLLFSVNLSASFLNDETFKKWLLQKTKSLGTKAKQLIIEVPEFGVVNHIDKAREFFLIFSAMGGKVSIDHYGKSFNSFSYLYNLKLHYLKIDGGFVKNIHEKEENQFFIRTLVDIAHSLGICVIAESVENENEYLALKKLKVDGTQGYYIAKPKELPI